MNFNQGVGRLQFWAGFNQSTLPNEFYMNKKQVYFQREMLHNTVYMLNNVHSYECFRETYYAKGRRATCSLIRMKD